MRASVIHNTHADVMRLSATVEDIHRISTSIVRHVLSEIEPTACNHTIQASGSIASAAIDECIHRIQHCDNVSLVWQDMRSDKALLSHVEKGVASTQPELIERAAIVVEFLLKLPPR